MKNGENAACIDEVAKKEKEALVSSSSHAVSVLLGFQDVERKYV